MSPDVTPQKPRRRKEDRPGEILDAAMEEFSCFGFERARLDQIAKSAGIAKGTIYLYFEGKEALFEAAIEQYIVGVMEETRIDFEQDNGTPAELLRKLISKTYKQVVGSHAETIMRILVSEGVRFPWMAERYYELAISKFIVLLRGLIERGVETGDFEPSAITRTPELIIAPAMFLSMNRMVFGTLNPIDKDAYFDGHLEMVIRAITPLEKRAGISREAITLD